MTWISAGDLMDCKFERLAAPSRLRLFAWERCSGREDCQHALFLRPALQGKMSSVKGFRIGPIGRAHDDGEIARVTLLTDAWSNSSNYTQVAWVTDDDGYVLDAFRLVNWDTKCTLETTDLWSSRFGLMFRSGDDTEGWLLAEVGSAVPPVLVPLIGPHFPHQMGLERWAYGYGVSMKSASNVTGDDVHVFAQVEPPKEFTFAEGHLEGLRSMGEYFIYYRRLFAPVFGNLEIHISDGVLAGQPYLLPPPGEDYFAAAFASSHVIWLRGLNQDLTSGAFGKVELWASPFSPDPAKLSPEKLGDTSLAHEPYEFAGGWGRYVLPTAIDEVEVWDAVSHEATHFNGAAYGNIWHVLGLTRHHLFVTTDPDGNNAGDDLLRFSLE